MSRRSASVTQADIARAIRAAKQAGAAEVVIEVPGQSKITIRLASSTGAADRLETESDIGL